MAGNSVHILFVHGVGQHSPLSSLLRAYQSLRSDLRSPEAPIVWEDPIPDWRLADFDDLGPPPFLKLVPRYPGKQLGPDNVYLYEANYSALAGVIRANQPLDITRLFVGFDLAVNVARERLRKEIRKEKRAAAELSKHAEIGTHVQKLADVLVAATVPILGIPSLIFRNYTSSWVAIFTRFFEDIATFAMDKNGEQLISQHVDRTVRNIVDSNRFLRAKPEDPGDTFVIAAHSLGTIVTHNFLLRHWSSGGPVVPRKLLTYGSPIGLVCWVWRFLDFPRLKFNAAADQATGDEYFCWTPEPAPKAPLAPIEWINVINHLDPIASAFPIQDISLAMPAGEIQRSLLNKTLTHHYIKTGIAFSLGSAHTNYFDDRQGFVDILGRLAGLVPDAPPRPASREPSVHWQQMRSDLLWMRWVLWACGLVAIGVYFGWLSSLYGAPVPWLLVGLYVWPPATIAVLAFFQKLIFGGPTKRTRPKTLKQLRWADWWAFPYRLRQIATVGNSESSVAARRANAIAKLSGLFLAFLPTIIAMALPVLWWRFVRRQGAGLGWFVMDHPGKAFVLAGAFMVYTMAFAGSEFARHWRNLLCVLTAERKGDGGQANPGS
jgi:hypothetical protein